MASTILQQILENVRGGTLLPLDGAPPPPSLGPVSAEECRRRLHALLERECERLVQAGAGVLALRGVHHCDPRQLERLESVWETLITSELLAGDWVRHRDAIPAPSTKIAPDQKPIHVAKGSFEPLAPREESVARPSSPPSSSMPEKSASSRGGLGVLDDFDDAFSAADYAEADAPTDSFTAEDLEAQLEALQTTVNDIGSAENVAVSPSTETAEIEPPRAESIDHDVPSSSKDSSSKASSSKDSPPKPESGGPTPGDLLRNSGAAAVLSGAPLASFSPDVLHEIRDLLVTLKEDTGDGILARLQTLTHEVRELSRRPVYAAGPAEDGSNAAESILPEKRVEIDDIQGMIDGLLGT